MEDKTIKVRYIDLSDIPPIDRLMLTPADKDKLLAALGITRAEEQTHLGAWVLAMCKENGLPETLPSYPIADAITGDISTFVWAIA